MVIKRKYVQDGKVVPGINATNSITDKFCNQQKKAFRDTNDFKNKGGFSKLRQVFDRGMVLVLSFRETTRSRCSGTTNKDKSTPGVNRGPCPTSSGKPTDVESQSTDAIVVYGNIKFGALDSTSQTSHLVPRVWVI
jgi:cellulose 1,4-beta-cellobiosidase